MDAYKILLWTTDPLLVLAVGAVFGALIGFGATFALLLGAHSHAAQARRESAFLEAHQNSGGSSISPITSRSTCRYSRHRIESRSDSDISERSRATNASLCSLDPVAIERPITHESAATVSANSKSSVLNCALPGFACAANGKSTGISCDTSEKGASGTVPFAFVRDAR